MTKTTAPTALDVKAAVDNLARGFEAFKAANDQRLNEIKTSGSADVLLEQKVDRINADLSAMSRAVDGLVMAGGRPGLGGTYNPDAAEHKQAFYQRFIRKGLEDGLARLEAKALSIGTDTEGGYAVPEELDRTIDRLLAKVSPVRRVAKVIEIGSSQYKKLINTGGTTSGWVGEEDARAETAAPSFAEVAPPLGEIYANPAATQAMLDDAFFNVEDWLAEELATEFAEQEGAAFISGDGSNKPKGFLSYTNSSAADSARAFGVLQYVPTGADAAFAASDPSDALVDLVYALRAPYRDKAVFMMNTNILADIRKFKDTEGTYLWRPGLDAGQPATLMGYPVEEAADMPDAASGSLSVAFGNFERGYTVTDRMGTRILRDPFTNKPYVHFYTTKRVGGGVVNSEAIKLLKFAAS